MRPLPSRPHHPAPRPGQIPDPGVLPEGVGQLVEIVTDPGMLELLGQAVDGVGAVVGALGDLSP